MQTAMVPAHTVTIPARPFFRSMIAQKSGKWASGIARQLKATNYDVDKTLTLTGESIKGQLQQSIRDFSNPPNAKSTVRKKGFNDPLIDTGHMLDSVDYEVSTNH
jgi:cobalamin biosynthesis Co2+ chelatase CbiK